MSNTLLLVIAGIMGIGSLGAIAYVLFAPEKTEKDIQAILRAHRAQRIPGGGMQAQEDIPDVSQKDFERLKRQQRKRLAKKKKKPATLEEKFYHAGIFSTAAKAEFNRLNIIIPAVMAPLLTIGMFVGTGDVMMGIYGLLIGAIAGLKMPLMLLNRRIKKRSEDILYYLPLVIEQIAIGVSSSLDIGPCLQRVVQMADERNTHNAVTELIKHAQKQMKSGVSMEEAMTEVGQNSGHTELKHAFMALAQVAKHGGEISKQLTELADAVSSQREAMISAKIKALELKATGPVALVFFGFLVIFMVGFAMQFKGL
ncbi:MAG: type II secretion system F family protein [Bdellovibrionales bacterium]|nr:type II secretion system F family protein [Bdellovibrionales bacterium]